MSLDVGSIQVKALLNTDNFDKNYKGVKMKVSDLGNSFKNFNNSALSVGKTISAFALGSGLALGAISVKIADSVGNVADLSRAFSTSTTKFQQFSAAALMSGVGASEVASMYEKLTSTIGETLSTYVNNSSKIEAQQKELNKLQSEYAKGLSAGYKESEPEMVKLISRINSTKSSIANMSKENGYAKNVFTELGLDMKFLGNESVDTTDKMIAVLKAIEKVPALERSKYIKDVFGKGNLDSTLKIITDGTSKLTDTMQGAVNEGLS